MLELHHSILKKSKNVAVIYVRKYVADACRKT
jgi:hypothetical protein